MERRSKYIFRAFMVLLIIFLIIINVPFPIRIETVALEIKLDDPDYLQERIVIIQGWYRINVFVSHHEFRGKIEISGYPQTQREMHNLGLSPVHIIGGGSRTGFRFGLMFYVADEGQSIYEPNPPFGLVHARLFMRELLIVVNDDDFGMSQTFSPVIAVGADSREDAINRLIPLFFYPASEFRFN
ncbi:MAG: hypothetical protein FWD01_02665 [Defluviitaleaceae bacterium]|nr:hypothetical protein [Defluviitaleaceae bacterium]